MKFTISFLLFLAYPHVAKADIIRISFEGSNRDLAQKVQEQMEREFYIPKDFVRMLEKRGPCERSRENVQWHLCINKNGNLEEVSVDRTFKNETLKVFL